MITSNGDITVYRFNAADGSYFPAVYRGVSIFHRKVTGFSDRGDGFVDSSVCTVRIDTERDIAISSDDYVFLGVGGAEIDKSRCLKVYSVTDNRRGKMTAHWRIDLK